MIFFFLVVSEILLPDEILVNQVWAFNMGVATRTSKLRAPIDLCSLVQDIGCAASRQSLVYGSLFPFHCRPTNPTLPTYPCLTIIYFCEWA